MAYLLSHDVKFMRIIEYPNDNKKAMELEENFAGQIGDLLLRWENGSCAEKSFFLKYKWVLKQVAPKNGNGNGNGHPLTNGS
jgi:hypothetical protein